MNADGGGVGGGGGGGGGSAAASVPTIDPATADARRSRETPAPILLDVREETEFAAVRAEGAVLAPMSTLGPRVGDLPRDRPIFVICAVGGRSASVASYLLANGWTTVFNVAGGTVAWERAGLPIRRGPTDRAEYDLPD